MYEIELTDVENGKALCVSSDGVYEASDTENAPIRMTLDSSGRPSVVTVETIESTVDLSAYALLNHTHVIEDISDVPFVPSPVMWYGRGYPFALNTPLSSYFFVNGYRVNSTTGSQVVPFHFNYNSGGKVAYLSAGAFALSAVSQWSLADKILSLPAASWLNAAGYHYYAIMTRCVYF